VTGSRSKNFFKDSMSHDRTSTFHSAGGTTEYSATIVLRATWMYVSVRLMQNSRTTIIYTTWHCGSRCSLNARF